MKLPVACVPALVASMLVAHPPCLQAQCTPQWDAAMGYPTTDGFINCSAVFDDGNGPALFVGGLFQSIGGTAAHGIAKTYDGIHWQHVGGGFVDSDGRPNARINAMTTFDPDGSGPQPTVLVVAGFLDFANDGATRVNHVAAWNGTVWSAFGSGLPTFVDITPDSGTREVLALEVFDSGTGPQLYAAGNIDFDNGVGDIAMFDGTSWITPGFTGTVLNPVTAIYDMCVHDDGTGPALYVTGSFTGIISVPNSAELARWNGTSWSRVGPTGVPAGGVHSNVESFDPDGPGGVPARLLCFDNNGRRLDIWNGSTWSSQTLPGPPLSGISVPMVQFNNGTGNALYFPAATVNPDLSAQFNMFRYDGTTFTSLGDDLIYIDGITPMTHMAINSLLDPNSLMIATSAGTTTVPANGGLMKFDLAANNYSKFVPVPSGPLTNYSEISPGNAANIFPAQLLQALPADLDGAGPLPATVVVRGDFLSVGDVPAPGLASNDGSGWGALNLAGIPTGHWLASILTERSATSTSPLYGAIFDSIPAGAFGLPGFGGVVRYDSGNWTALGSPTTFQQADGTPGAVSHLVSANFGSGTDLYAFGGFASVNGSPALRFARWNGTQWTPVAGAGIENAGPRWVAVHNDGSGDAIYISGNLMRPEGTSNFVSGVLKWDGVSWSNVSNGLPSTSFFGPQIEHANGQLWAIAQTDFGDATSQAVLRWNAGAWELAGSTTLPPGFLSGTKFVGVANLDGTDRFFFMSVDTTFHWSSGELISFDGETWTSHPEMGRVTVNFPTDAFSTQSNAGSSLWLFSAFPLFGVGGEIEPQSTINLNSLQGSQLARWFCPAAACNSIDFNGDGLFPDDSDLVDFLSVLAGGECSTGSCDGIDFNNDGLFPDDSDLIAFLRVLAGGDCTL